MKWYQIEVKYGFIKTEPPAFIAREYHRSLRQNTENEILRSFCFEHIHDKFQSYFILRTQCIVVIVRDFLSNLKITQRLNKSKLFQKGPRDWIWILGEVIRVTGVTKLREVSPEQYLSSCRWKLGMDFDTHLWDLKSLKLKLWLHNGVVTKETFVIFIFSGDDPLYQ